MEDLIAVLIWDSQALKVRKEFSPARCRADVRGNWESRFWLLARYLLPFISWFSSCTYCPISGQKKTTKLMAGRFYKIQQVSRWSWFQDLFWSSSRSQSVEGSAVNSCWFQRVLNSTTSFRDARARLRKVHCLSVSTAVGCWLVDQD